jgi:hypothetical protein
MDWESIKLCIGYWVLALRAWEVRFNVIPRIGGARFEKLARGGSVDGLKIHCKKT